MGIRILRKKYVQHKQVCKKKLMKINLLVSHKTYSQQKEILKEVRRPIRQRADEHCSLNSQQKTKV